MRAERLFQALGLVDPALVEEAVELRRQRTTWKRWAAMAACLTLVLGLGFGWFATGGFRGFGAGGGLYSGLDSGSSGGAPADSGVDGYNGAEEGITFMSYAGPVFPLTTLEDSSRLTAERTITWDFTPGAYPDGEPRQWGAEVSDTYVLRNDTDADIAATALYPFAGSFDSLAETRPQVSVDGESTEITLYAGPYSGGFESTYGAGILDTMNLDTLNSWHEYKALLENGSYLQQALKEYPVLDTPVTVYQFSDFSAPHADYPAATQAISFDINPEETTIFTYGINGMEWDETFRRYSYFVPDGMRNESDLKLLIVLGEDIGPYSLQGYENGGCHRGEEIDGVSCTVARSETTMDAVLDRLCREYEERYGLSQTGRGGASVSFEMYHGAVSELLTQYGVISSTPMDRYADGRLDDILSETLSHHRVLYLAFPVTVPAGGSASVNCVLWKEPSFDFACSGSENEGFQGYDLLTGLGSTLKFTGQSAALLNAENLEIAGQNFGFNLENGITTVNLAPETEHYYMELRPRGD